MRKKYKSLAKVLIVSTSCIMSLPVMVNAQDYRAVDAYFLNVRSQAEKGSSILGVLEKGTIISIEDIIYGWGKFTYNNEVGYVDTKYLKDAEKTTVETTELQQNQSYENEPAEPVTVLETNATMEEIANTEETQANMSDFNIIDGVLVEYLGSDSIVTIPESVTSIGDYAFYYCTPLESVIIPEGVVSIGERAFELCEALKTVLLPSTITSIGESAFAICYSLENIVIPDGVTSIANETFLHCIGLESVSIPDSVISIGDYAFSSSHSLKNVVIPEGVVSIGNGAFELCEELNDIIISNTVTSIGEFAFANCNSLENVIVPDNVTYVGKNAFVTYIDSEKVINVELPDELIMIFEENELYAPPNITYRD